MKVKSAVLLSLLRLVVGVVLIFLHNFDVFTALIIGLGIVFIIPGIISIFNLSATKNVVSEDKKTKPNSRFQIICGLISGVGSVIMGICMIGWSDMFVKFIPMIFGTILTLGGCFHLCAMAMAMRPIRVPFWLYILPIALIAMGISIIFIDKSILLDYHIILMTGIGLIVFSINSFIEIWFSRKIKSPMIGAAEIEVIDVKGVK